MPIHVTCPECQFSFAVADEYAGRPGRCPECNGFIQVPRAEHDFEADPYQTPRHTERFPEPAARRRETMDDPRPTPREREPRTFDAEARAAKWMRVANGYRNILIAMVLIAFDEMIRGTYNLVRGVEKVDPNNLDEGRLALVVGNLFVTAIAMVLWAMGRMAGRAVPYVPARSLSITAGVSAALTGFSGVAGILAMALGLVVARNNLQAGAGLFMLAVLAIMCSMMCGVVAEIVGLLSQLKVATGLRDQPFRRGTHTVIFVVGMMLGMGFMGCCVAMIAVGAAAEKQKQAQQKADKDKQAVKKAKEANEEKKDLGNAQGEVQNVPPKEEENPPPPEFNPEDHPELMAGLNIAVMVGTLVFCLAYINCMRLGRRAILREVDRLLGRESEYSVADHDDPRR